MTVPADLPRRDFRRAVKQTLTRLVAAGPHLGQSRPVPVCEAAHEFSERAALVALAIDRLSGASVRAAASGKPVSVSVPDADTAAVFAAALALTSKRRVTDRLLTIVVEEPARYPS
jgi:hypothetical protein